MPFGTAGGLAPTPSAIGKGASKGGKGYGQQGHTKGPVGHSGLGTANPTPIGPGKDGYPGGKTGQQLRQEAARTESARLQKQITPDMTSELVKFNKAISTRDREAIQKSKQAVLDTGYKFGQTSRINLLNDMSGKTKNFFSDFAGDPSLGFVNNKTGEKYNVNKIASMSIPDFNKFMNDKNISREGDPDSGLGALVNIGSMLMPGWPAAVVGAVKTVGEASQGRLPFGISLPKASGPTVTVQSTTSKGNKKKNGKIKKKNYAKGGGVRSAKY